MNYCFTYNKHTEHMKYINNASEWTIIYNSKDTTLLKFLDLHKDKKINLYIKDADVNIDFCKKLIEKYDNLYLLFTENFYNILKENMLNFKKRFFFDTKVSEWDTFIGLIEMGVCSIYIVENLGFELKDAAEIAHERQVLLRAYPNVAQSAWTDAPALKKFFIRPEDIEYYSQFIDVFEFFNEDTNLDTYYEIYEINRKWLGQLNEIIIDFNSDLDNKYIIPRFAEKRVNCGKICLKGKRCTRCDRIEQLAKSLEQSKLIVKVEKK